MHTITSSVCETPPLLDKVSVMKSSAEEGLDWKPLLGCKVRNSISTSSRRPPKDSGGSGQLLWREGQETLGGSSFVHRRPLLRLSNHYEALRSWLAGDSSLEIDCGTKDGNDDDVDDDKENHTVEPQQKKKKSSCSSSGTYK